MRSDGLTSQSFLSFWIFWCDATFSGGNSNSLVATADTYPLGRFNCLSSSFIQKNVRVAWTPYSSAWANNEVCSVQWLMRVKLVLTTAVSVSQCPIDIIEY